MVRFSPSTYFRKLFDDLANVVFYMRRWPWQDGWRVLYIADGRAITTFTGIFKNSRDLEAAIKARPDIMEKEYRMLMHARELWDSFEEGDIYPHSPNA